MSKPSKKKFEKKKKREQEGYLKTLKRREKIRQEAKRDKERSKLEREVRIKLKPFVKEGPKPHAKTEEEVIAQIEENFAALKVLEEQYQRVNEEREGLNSALEAEGFTTLKEKMDFLNKQAMEQAQIAIDSKKKRMSKKKEKPEKEKV